MNILQDAIEYMFFFREVFAISLIIVLSCCFDMIFYKPKVNKAKQIRPEWLDAVVKEVVNANHKELYEAQTACLEHLDKLELQIEVCQRALPLLNGKEAQKVNKKLLDYSNQMLRLI